MCTDTRAAFLEYLFAILCICDIEQHFIEFLATNRRRYVVWLLANSVCEWIRQIGYVCVVYGLEDLFTGAWRVSSNRVRWAGMLFPYSLDVVVLYCLFCKGQDKHQLDSCGCLVAVPSGGDEDPGVSSKEATAQRPTQHSRP